MTLPYYYSREEFCAEVFDYKPGEHAVFAGPTQRGKTTLAFNLLQHCASKDCPAYVAVSKPRDPTTEKWGKKLGFRTVREWPPGPSFKAAFSEKPNGYVIWPKFGDINNDIDNCAVITASLINDRYTQGVNGHQGILMLDDTVTKSKVYKLDNQMTTVIVMAGAMDLGAWVFVQRPTGAGNTALWSYGNSEHIFLFPDPDKRNRERYDEIGGVDPRYVREIAQDKYLKPYECIYIKRTGGLMCIVGA
jgi:hypothetical protein